MSVWPSPSPPQEQTSRSGLPLRSGAPPGAGSGHVPPTGHAPTPRLNETESRLDVAGSEAARCIHCGFCLPACPTYQVFGVEKHSPRGRIQLVKGWANGHVEPDDSFMEALDLCLGCRACETACPVDVRYGIILESARDELAERRSRGAGQVQGVGRVRGVGQVRGVGRVRGLAKVLQRWALRHIAAHPRRLGILARLTARLLRTSAGRRLQVMADCHPEGWLASALTFARALPAGRRREAEPRPADGPLGAGPQPTTRSQPFRTQAPTPTRSVWEPDHSEQRQLAPGHRPTAQDGGPRAAVFLGCAQQGLFPRVNETTAQLLAAAGFRVETRPGQGCCGALHRHQGDPEHARQLVLRNLQAFGFLGGGTPPDVVVFNAGGCLAWIKEMASMFPEGTPERTAAEELAARAKDVSEALSECGWKPGKTIATGAGLSRPLRVVYQPSCHLTHVCGITEAPLALLRSLPGVAVTLPADGGACCGSAGIYSALHPQASAAILARKMDHITGPGFDTAEAELPDIIVTSNPGCHLQMVAGVSMAGLADRVAVMQLPEFVEYRLRTFTSDAILLR